MKTLFADLNEIYIFRLTLFFLLPSDSSEIRATGPRCVLLLRDWNTGRCFPTERLILGTKDEDTFVDLDEIYNFCLTFFPSH